ncbi:hypothetical protein SEPCBS57363_004584 [Sporothrix epigloea]|uniref:Defect at low temperature protein 1 n=1 Tax=Sporothrix epigloea TaxID=1892477 RepID=A0ABP0DSX0_9PEZI
MASSAAVFFRIIYATAYLFLHLLLLALLLISPGDIINQSRDRHDVVSILIVAACSVFAILAVIFVFFLRLFLKRAVLNSIPRSWIPIEKGDVPKHVRNIISAGLSRSAAVAFVSRPRVLPDELLDELCPMLVAGAFIPGSGDQGADKQGEADKEGAGVLNVSDPRRPKAVKFKKTETIGMEKELGIDLPPCQAVWGEIEHPGWAPPDRQLGRWGNKPARGHGLRSSGTNGTVGEGVGGSGSLLDEKISLQYSTVLAELPSLIEAKVMTLAPRDFTTPADPPMLDADAVALLERPKYMGMRDYIALLAGLGVIDMQAEVPAQVDGAAIDGDLRPLGDVVSSFATLYEYARFSTHMLSYDEFGQLMHDLATILRCMTSPDPSMLHEYEDDAYESVSGASYSFSDLDNRSGRLYYAKDEQEEDVDVNNSASVLSLITRLQSRSRRSSSQSFSYSEQQPEQEQQHEAQAHPFFSRNVKQSYSRSQSTSSRRSAETSMSTSSSARSNGSSNSRGSGGTSRRHRPSQWRTAASPTDSPDASPPMAQNRQRQGSSSRHLEPMLARRRFSSRASTANIS